MDDYIDQRRSLTVSELKLFKAYFTNRLQFFFYYETDNNIVMCVNSWKGFHSANYIYLYIYIMIALW